MKVLQKIGDFLDRVCGFLTVIMIGAMVTGKEKDGILSDTVFVSQS